MKKQTVGNYNIDDTNHSQRDDNLTIANETKTLITKYRDINDSTEDFKNDFPKESRKVKDALNNYVSENNPNFWKQKMLINGTISVKTYHILTNISIA